MPVIVRLFWSGGYSQLTLDQVAAELGVTKPTLYRSLGEKETIFAAALEAYHQTYIQPCEQHWEHAPTLHQALAEGFAVVVERILDNDLPPGCFMGDTAAGEFPTGLIAATLESLQGRMASTLHQRVERAIEEGELQPTTSPATVIQFILGQFAALSAVSRTNPTRSDLDAVVGYILAGLPWTEAR
ncbi:MAG: TetR/AcrR family transcriptional regulator [Actinomycetota bacterium]|nr:TetR/AcrR family transcriptional regulator [Actinomycetota bacterium]